MMLPVSPEVFDGIQFRGIGRQPFQHQRALGGQQSPEPTGSGGWAVSHTTSPGMTYRVLPRSRLDGSRIQSSATRFQTLPVEGYCSTGVCPRGDQCVPIHAARSARFRPRTLWFDPRFGLFFNLRPALLLPLPDRLFISFQGRPVGRWQLHPNCRNIRQTWPGWYVTPLASPIKWATRLAVHSLVSYPSASGPRFKPPSIFFRSLCLLEPRSAALGQLPRSIHRLAV